MRIVDIAWNRNTHTRSLTISHTQAHTQTHTQSLRAHSLTLTLSLLPIGNESERNPHPIFSAQGRESNPVTIAC